MKKETVYKIKIPTKPQQVPPSTRTSARPPQQSVQAVSPEQKPAKTAPKPAKAAPKPAKAAPKSPQTAPPAQQPARPAPDSPPVQVPHPWSKDALLTKAQRYAEEMLSHDRDDWRFGILSSLALELLARAALAHVSPALLADPKEWTYLYYALGHTPKTPKFIPKSVDISAVFARLREIVPKFDVRLEGQCVLHLTRRNDELHSGNSPFDGIGTSDWLPVYYEACDVLLSSIGESLATFLGPTEAAVAAQMIAASTNESAKAVAKRVQACKTLWDALSDEERERKAAQASLWASRRAGHGVQCPACSSFALLNGSPAAPPVQRLKDGKVVETQAFLPSRFECISCGLKVSGLAELHACKLGDAFKATSTYEPSDYYRLHDEYEGYEDDNNEP